MLAAGTWLALDHGPPATARHDAGSSPPTTTGSHPSAPAAPAGPTDRSSPSITQPSPLTRALAAPVDAARSRQAEIRDLLAAEVRRVRGVDVGAYGTVAGMRAYARAAGPAQDVADITVDDDRDGSRSTPGVCGKSLGTARRCSVVTLQPGVEQTVVSGTTSGEQWVTATVRRVDGVTVTVTSTARAAGLPTATLLTDVRATAVVQQVARLLGVLPAAAPR